MASGRLSAQPMHSNHTLAGRRPDRLLEPQANRDDSRSREFVLSLFLPALSLLLVRTFLHAQVFVMASEEYSSFPVQARIIYALPTRIRRSPLQNEETLRSSVLANSPKKVHPPAHKGGPFPSSLSLSVLLFLARTHVQAIHCTVQEHELGLLAQLVSPKRMESDRETVSVQ